MGTITTNNFSTRAGAGSVSLTEATLPTISVEMESISSISADFDTEDSEDNASSIYIALGEFEFTLFDKLDNGNSLFDALNSVTSTSIIQINLSFTTNGGRVIDENYYCYPRDVDYDRTGRRVTIKSHQKPTFTDTVEDIFANNPSDVYDLSFYGSSPGVEDCMPIKAYIENVLALFNSSNTIYNNSSIFNVATESGGTPTYVLVNRSTGPAKDELLRYAAAEGSIVGSMMGYNFYSNRLSTSSAASLSQDDVEEDSLKVMVGLNSYFTIREVFNIGISNNGYNSYAHLTGDSDGLNDSANKRLDIFFSSGLLEKATWSAGSNEYVGESSSPSGFTTTGIYVDGGAQKGSLSIAIDDGSGGSAPIDLSDGDLFWFEDINNLGKELSPFYIADNANGGDSLDITTPLVNNLIDNLRVRIFADTGINEIAEQGVASYAAAYGATGKSEIELTVFDIDKLKPGQPFTFDSSFPTGLAGNTYFPSKPEYDLNSDKIKMKAYQIG